MSTLDRRAPGAVRIPFDALVEVGSAVGPSFEAQAVNVSEEGMLLRTTYLPEPGQPLTCRFDAGSGQSVLASGEVVWARGAQRGGEFGVRFTEMDAESVDVLRGVCGLAAEGGGAQAHPGSKVRLHIEGLAAPMRAKIKGLHTTEVTVGSDLGFLQVGKALELEDAQSGQKRPACIHCVEVAVDPSSQVPQLVVTLRYTDVAVPTEDVPADRMAFDSGSHGAQGSAGSSATGVVARKLASVGATLERLAARARTTVALLASGHRDGADDAPRRTTAPAPGGGLRAAGRRVVRGEDTGGPVEEPEIPPLPRTRGRQVAVASAVMIAAVAGALVLKKVHQDPPGPAGPVAASTPTTAGALAATTAGPLASAGLSTAPPGPGAPMSSSSPSSVPEPAAAPPAPGAGTVASADDDTEAAAQLRRKRARVAPFGNGPVHHGNILRLKMDGPIDSLEGAQEPTGFVVKLPGRKSLEPAAPLAARDSRIAGIKVSNGTGGAELTVEFKDGVPNYQVSARGDTLVLALASAGTLEKAEKTVANKDERGGASPKHGKHLHKHRGTGGWL